MAIMPFKMALKHSAQVLSSGPKQKVIRVLDKLHSGMNNSAVGHRFSVNEQHVVMCL